MAYKSNKQALAEYLDNKNKNHERYARDYARRKAARGAAYRRRVVLVFLALMVIVWLVSHHRAVPSVSTYPASYQR